MTYTAKLETATFGGGCFWCTEAVFENLKGVKSVPPGYTGGTLPSPTYEDVTSGKSGHVETILIEYDPKLISYDDLLSVFFATHDPTSLDRQGNDVGEQYRSVIFYSNTGQMEKAQAFIEKL